MVSSGGVQDASVADAVEAVVVAAVTTGIVATVLVVPVAPVLAVAESVPQHCSGVGVDETGSYHLDGVRVASFPMLQQQPLLPDYNLAV